MNEFPSIAGLVEEAERERVAISKIAIRRECELRACDEDSVLAEMDRRLSVMEASEEAGLDPSTRSSSGLSGGAGSLVMRRAASDESVCGGMHARAIARAMAIAECNAAMGRIVAAPTAGSCGILPAAILTMLEGGRVTRADAVRGLFTASAVGMVIARNACLAGAQGGCQAECGSASAMAAASVTELLGGSPEQVARAVSIALQNVLGLVCDPVAGLVECPCVMRNASGVAGALTAAEIALAGVDPIIPADESIAAMKEVGDQMPACLRETAQGGLAATPTAKRIQERLFGE